MGRIEWREQSSVFGYYNRPVERSTWRPCTIHDLAPAFFPLSPRFSHYHYFCSMFCSILLTLTSTSPIAPRLKSFTWLPTGLRLITTVSQGVTGREGLKGARRQLSVTMEAQFPPEKHVEMSMCCL